METRSKRKRHVTTETHGGPHDIRSKREFEGEEERVGISVLQVILFINALEKERFVQVQRS